MAPAIWATPHRASRAREGARHVILVGPALLDEAHHRVRLAHAIADSKVGDGHARHADEAMTIHGAQQAALVDGDHVDSGGLGK